MEELRRGGEMPADAGRNRAEAKCATHVVHMWKAFGFSLQGLRGCFRDELAFRQECVLGIVHFALLVVLPLELWLKVVLGVVFALVLAAELLNTAVEAVVDLASPGKNELAKKAKDCGSAAVAILLAVLFSCWVIAFVCISRG